MELPNIAAYAYQDVHVWSALLTCLRPHVLPHPLSFPGAGGGHLVNTNFLLRLTVLLCG